MSVLDERFPDWYRTVALSDDEALFTKRKAAIRALLKGHKKLDSLELTRLAHAHQCGDEFGQRFQATFSEADDSYGTGEHEQQVLAAACVAVLMERGEDPGLVAAYAVGSAAFAGWTPAIKALPTVAADALREQAVAQRDGVREPEGKTVADRVEEGLSKLVNGEEPAPALDLRQALAVVAASVDERIDEAERAFLVSDEEVNLLWWVVGQRSLRQERSWKESSKGLPLLAALELGKMTAMTPGPVTVDAFIERALRDADRDPGAKDSVTNLVKEAEAWSVPAATEIPSEARDFAPVLGALSAGEEVQFGTGWTKTASKQTGYTTSRKVTAIQLASQVYSELMLLRLLDG